jgi:hypothetical protein
MAPSQQAPPKPVTVCFLVSYTVNELRGFAAWVAVTPMNTIKEKIILFIIVKQ